MPTPSHHRSRMLATATIAAAHGWLAIVAFNGLLSFTQPPQFEVLEIIANQWYWGWIHLACMLMLFASMLDPRGHVRFRGWTLSLPNAAVACNVGFALLTTWAIFHLLWGLSATRPVSLAGPGLALIVALGEQILAHAWARGTYTKAR